MSEPKQYIIGKNKDHDFWLWEDDTERVAIASCGLDFKIAVNSLGRLSGLALISKIEPTEQDMCKACLRRRKKVETSG